ncbi:FdhF/YdeP family oxidoreductase [Noviherbaspirillum suwonense]|uniref:Oxidoreductase alpha (Molybdopterin) subunit n=1 Tax=Noviherbaspirillum suwonense TaxID=1224511 RepID=A0ABY1PXV4_9BURK|nr:FdhF/YdeP family oxidoreductase [Noviherbaspirillum suwonense]SMP52400.1 oxidoreductase alpha (molybdopterin) subunit [Noviherbaspirillum suwonense]
MSKEEKFESAHQPAGGWGSVKAVTKILAQEKVLLQGGRVLMKQNKPDGFACVSCAWAKPAHPHPAEFCSNGAQATAWEITSKRVDPGFFQRHTATELESWTDHALEAEGRLTAPLRWDAASDKYLEVTWKQAFDEIGAELKKLAPKSSVFYTSGRASLETAYMFQLLARMYGCNNLPDSSNMCHESTSVALPETIGVPIGTVALDDFETTDCIFFFGQNVGTNSPRMLHQLQEARKRGVPVITFNPLRERGLVSFTNPQDPAQMLTADETGISTQYLQLKAGGDSAALMGLCKFLVEWDDAALRDGRARVLDARFIEQHAHGFEEFAAAARACSWESIERESGLDRGALELAAGAYANARAVIGVYGMGLTQHKKGVQNVQMLSNLLLLKGNIGKPGAGICPVRGHSNVQGQRTVGISEKPELVPLDKLEQQFGFKAPRDKGLATVDTCHGILDGSVRAFVSLGGNFVRAAPETDLLEPAWRRLRLSVQIATKLNRSHVLHGEVAYILPCLGRIEIDRQASGEQAVSVEDSTGCMHGSRGQVEPASPGLLSEPAIVAGIAQAALAPNPALDWQTWVGDYSLIRAEIARTWPEIFHDFEARMWKPGGFARPIAARQRIWKTPTGKATFVAPASLDENPDMPGRPDVLTLFTLRSDGQFNTTIYHNDDRFRGVYGTRRVLLMNPGDIQRLGFAEGDRVTAATLADDGVDRTVAGLRVTPYNVPQGCAAGYFPECNPLIPLWHHAEESMVPAAKAISITLSRTEAA